MKKVTQRSRPINFLKSFWIVTFGLAILTGCQFSYFKNEFQKGKEATSQGEYSSAVEHFSRVIKKDPDSDIALESAREAARISYLETKNFRKAIEFYKFIIIYSDSAEERLEAQKKLALIYFEKLADFERSIEAFNKLIQLKSNREEEYQYRFNIAKSYFQLSKFYQAEVELNTLLEKYKEPSKQFELLMFEGNLFLTTKNHPAAIRVFEKLMETFPKKSSEENVGMNLAAVYEDLQQFAKAVEILNRLRLSERSPEFIDLKIKRLEERARHLPGAQGFRK